MEIIGTDRHFGLEMINILGADPKCKYCGENITGENFGGIFSKPTRICCDDIGCLFEAIYDTEKNEATGESLIPKRGDNVC